MADIFVSYTSSDRDWAFWIAKELDALAHTPHIHEWEIKGGDDIYAWMEARHDAADHVLCVVSDDYLKAPYSTLERNAALWQAAGKRPGFVLFVAVKPCRLPSLADHIRRCELFGVPEDAARIRFRDFMAARAAPAAAAFPDKVFALSNISIRVPAHFMGRGDSLDAIENALKRYEGRVAITALHGLRGVGKTTLAAAYAERHRGDYRATWWIRAQTEPSMRADLAALGVRLGWVAADDKEEPALAAVLERLRHEGDGILLIYDNAPDAAALAPCLPRGGAAQVLVTSNARVWRGVAAPVEIRLWPKEVGADYLIARTGREGERAAALALSEALGGLPLAHEQAAAYCERLDLSFVEYAKRFETAPARLLDDTRHAPAEYHDGLTVAKTFALAIDEAAKLHPAAEPLIVHAALLAPEPIPLYLFADAREKFGEPLASALANDGLDEAVAVLRSFALIDRETIADEREPSITTDCIRLHRLVRQIAAARRDGKSCEDARHALAVAVTAIYPDSVFEQPETWPRARRLDVLAMTLVRDATLSPGIDRWGVSLLTSLAAYRQRVIASYAQARPLFERALAMCEKARGPWHPDTAMCLHNLSLLLKEQGDAAAAERLYERSLTIQEKMLASEHPAIAGTLNQYARLLHERGDLATARPLYERALAIQEKVLGPEHPETAKSLSNLANLLMLEAQVDPAAVRALHERALAAVEKVLGPEHPETATNLNNLAAYLTHQGDLGGAQPLYERALAILEKGLSPEHPYTNRVRFNLALLLLTSGIASRAYTFGEAALAAHDKALGASHAWTKDSARVTADALAALGRAEEAAALRARYGLGDDTSKS